VERMRGHLKDGGEWLRLVAVYVARAGGEDWHLVGSMCRIGRLCRFMRTLSGRSQQSRFVVFVACHPFFITCSQEAIPSVYVPDNPAYRPLHQLCNSFSPLGRICCVLTFVRLVLMTIAHLGSRTRRRNKETLDERRRNKMNRTFRILFFIFIGCDMPLLSLLFAC
jgi:hypothetical protein